MAQAGSLPGAIACRIAGVSQRAFLLEFARNSGDSGTGIFGGTGNRVARPTTRPTISASSGVFHDSACTARADAVAWPVARAPAETSHSDNRHVVQQNR